MKTIQTKHHKIRFELLPNFKGKLLDDVYYDYFGFKGIIHKGFITDGASIPFLLWTLFDPFDLRTVRASTIHDYLYEHKKNVKRFWCDIIFLAVMKESKCPYWKRHLYFWAVMLCGWYPRDVKPFIKKLISKIK
jgi:hypothetical protein